VAVQGRSSESVPVAYMAAYISACPVGPQRSDKTLQVSECGIGIPALNCLGGSGEWCQRNPSCFQHPIVTQGSENNASRVVEANQHAQLRVMVGTRICWCRRYRLSERDGTAARDR
jgi:hypothetical protein